LDQPALLAGRRPLTGLPGCNRSDVACNLVSFFEKFEDAAPNGHVAFHLLRCHSLEIIRSPQCLTAEGHVVVDPLDSFLTVLPRCLQPTAPLAVATLGVAVTAGRKEVVERVSIATRFAGLNQRGQVVPCLSWSVAIDA